MCSVMHRWADVREGDLREGKRWGKSVRLQPYQRLIFYLSEGSLQRAPAFHLQFTPPLLQVFETSR